METKFWAPVQIEGFKAAEDGSYEVAGYAARFNNVDLGGDVILPGAFKDWLSSGNATRFLFSHRPDQIVGRPLEMREDAKGLFVRAKISKTALGEDIHTLLKDKALDSFSIGYIARDFDYTKDGEVRQLKAVDLPEFSLVSLPMNPEAVVTAVKGAEAIEELKDTWTSSYISDLPDSAFAVVLDGGSKDDSGKTTPRDLRKLPHHDTSGKVDLPHLRNALSREPQTQMPAAAHEKARAHLERHAAAEGIGDHGGSGGKAADDDVETPETSAPEPEPLPSLSELPLSEHAELLGAELAAFVARAQDALGDLASKGRDLTDAKRQTLEALLERCSGLEAVRSDLAAVLAPAAIPLNPVKRRLESTRRRLLAEGILAAEPAQEPTQDPAPEAEAA